MYMLWCASSDGWTGVVHINEREAVFPDNTGSIQGTSQDFWKEPMRAAISKLLEKSHERSEDKKPFVFLDYHGNIASPFLGVPEERYMLESLKAAFPNIQGEILNEFGILSKEDSRKKLFDVARSHMADVSGQENVVKPVLTYVVDLLKTIKAFDLDMALLSSTSIKSISHGFSIFNNIEGQLIQAGISGVVRELRVPHLPKAQRINRTSLGFFMEKQDKAQGFETIMKDLGCTSAIVMEDSQDNIAAIKKVAKNNHWNLLIVDNNESLRQRDLLSEKEDRDTWKEIYRNYLKACLSKLPKSSVLSIFSDHVFSRPPTAKTTDDVVSFGSFSQYGDADVEDPQDLFKTQIPPYHGPLTQNFFPANETTHEKAATHEETLGLLDEARKDDAKDSDSDHSHDAHPDRSQDLPDSIHQPIDSSRERDQYFEDLETRISSHQIKELLKDFKVAENPRCSKEDRKTFYKKIVNKGLCLHDSQPEDSDWKLLRNYVAKASFWLGSLCEDSRKLAQAYKWYKKSLDTKHSGAKEKLEKIRNAQGYAKAQMELGKKYQSKGEQAKAFLCYKEAEHKGDPDIFNELGSVYDAVQEYEKAKTLFEKAKDHPGANFNLGNLYEKRFKDFRKACESYRAAALREHSDAQIRFGYFCERGWGTEKNCALSGLFYRKALGHGNKDAPAALERVRALQHYTGEQLTLGNTYYREKNYPLALICFEESAGKDYLVTQFKFYFWPQKVDPICNIDAQFNLGLLYREGQGVAKNYVKARQWFEKAALGGHANAQFNLGYLYNEGQGVTKDPEEARKWFEKASAQGEAASGL